MNPRTKEVVTSPWHYVNCGRKVHVHWNSQRKCFAISQGGKVRAYATTVWLRGGVTYHVQEAGRARYLREGVRNVHAYVKGFICSLHPVRGYTCSVNYYPDKFAEFVRGDGTPIFESASATLTTFDGFPQTLSYNDFPAL